jgi:hypothetical protein
MTLVVLVRTVMLAWIFTACIATVACSFHNEPHICICIASILLHVVHEQGREQAGCDGLGAGQVIAAALAQLSLADGVHTSAVPDAVCGAQHTAV